MFDAARAALLWSGAQVEASAAKTHGGLISAFSLHLVKTVRVPAELGKALNRASEIRLVADYSGDGVDEGNARLVIQQAERFLQTIRQCMEPPAPGQDKEGGLA